MRVQKTNKAFAYRIYSHFTQQCIFKDFLNERLNFLYKGQTEVLKE